MFNKFRSACFLATLIFTIATASSQVATGAPPFSSLGGGPFDSINLGNLNVHFAIPVVNKAGRGMPFTYDLSYDSSVWYPSSSSGTLTWTPVQNWGWRGQTEAAVGYITYTSSSGVKCNPDGHETHLTNYVYHDMFGVPHNFPGSVTLSCDGNSNALNATATDGSGYILNIPIDDNLSASITSRSGTVRLPPQNNPAHAGTVTDANGNQMGVNGSGVFTDTLGTTALSVSGAPPSATTFTYTGPSGSAHFSMNYSTYNLKTNFGCGGVAEYAANGISLVSSIALPDSSRYSFTYETTPGAGNSGFKTGRLASVTLPSGGTISYTYPGANDGIVCADGSTAELDRTTPDSSTSWTYSRALSGSTWVNTVVDPEGDNTVINFAKDGSTANPTSNFYELQRQVYQGAISSSNLLLTVLTCWNNNFSSCSTHAVSSPITQRDAYTIVPNNKTSLSQTLYNSYGLITEDDEYDWGVVTGSAPTGSTVSTTLTSYNTTLGNSIVDRPAQVQVRSGSATGTLRAQTTYSYDESSVTTTTGTPQHVAITGSRGNLTTASGLTTGTSTLSKHFTYFDTGNLHTSTDVNTAVTTFIYGACGNSFATEVDLPLTLTRHMTWDCNGGVAKTTVDENSKTTTYSYTDPNFWRLNQVSYPDGGSTTTTYNTASAPSDIVTSSKQNSSTNVTTDTVFDGLGRVSQTQVTSDPSGTDYVDTSYDALGRVYSVSNPHRSASSPTDGTTYYSYDALGRVSDVTNADGTHLTKSYTSRAVLVTDASGIQEAFQNDGLGRLQYVCDGIGAVKQANNATTSSCGLDISASGFLATYGEDAMGNMTSVNFSGQTRSFAYDGLSRMTSETNPESGTITYVYDSGTPGDLYTRTFPKPNASSGNVTATYSWDAMHRPTGITFSDGSSGYAYVYDASSLWDATLLNPKGRLVEQSHTGGAAAIYSYDLMGRVADTWACTPETCGTSSRHLAYTYNYLGEVLTNVDGQGTTFSNAYDAAGRLTGLTSSLVNATHPGTLFSGGTYNPLGGLTQGTYGDGIVRNNTYNNMGRLTEIQDGPTASPTYRVYLVYGPNGSVASYNDTVVHSWSFTYDAFNRLATSSNGDTGDAYSYSYDQFGNRWKQTVRHWVHRELHL